MVVYLILAILKQRYNLKSSLSKLLHFLEINLFEQKSLESIFNVNLRNQPTEPDNQLILFKI